MIAVEGGYIFLRSGVGDGSVKKHLVRYATEEEATATCQALATVIWTPDSRTPSLLGVFAKKNEVRQFVGNRQALLRMQGALLAAQDRPVSRGPEFIRSFV